jgi:uncharacterized protein
MTPDIARRAVDLLMSYSRKIGNVSILFFGGEPFLNFNVLRTAAEYAEEQAKAHHKTLRFNCTSNCTVLTDGMLDFIARHRIPVLTSVDGLEDTHDRSRRDRRGHGTFKRVIKNLHRLKQAQGFVGAKVTVMPENVSKLFDDVRGLYDLGISTFVIGYASGIEWADQERKSYWAQLRELRRWQARAHSKDVNLIGLPESIPPPPAFRCKAGSVSISVAPDGQISLCSKLPAQGSSRPAATLGDVFNGLTHFRNRFELVYGRRLESACRRLKLDSHYSGGCIADNFLETGNLFTPGKRQYAIESLRYAKC